MLEQPDDSFRADVATLRNLLMSLPYWPTEEFAALERIEAAEGRRLRADEVDALTRGAYEDGKGDGRAESRRQATEGWEREWGNDSPKFIAVRRAHDEAEARDRAVLNPSLVVASRLVGPWEPAEQPEPASEEPDEASCWPICEACFDGRKEDCTRRREDAEQPKGGA